jgi:hypothetical protein
MVELVTMPRLKVGGIRLDSQNLKIQFKLVAEAEN